MNWLLLLLLLISTPAWATDVFVDNASSCVGDDGSSANPWCSIQDALDNAAAGQDIKIRTGTGTYSETAFVSGKNGTAVNKIILEPDTGAKFVIRNSGAGAFTASITIKESDYWTIRNLTFDADGVNPSMMALFVQCETKDCLGWLIQGNTFQHWHQGGTYGPLVLYFAGCRAEDGCSTDHTISGTITGNTWSDVELYAMEIYATLNTTISNNTASNIRCGDEGDGSATAAAMHVQRGSQGIRITGNTFYDISAITNCASSAAGYQTSSGVWADACRPAGAGDQDSEVTGNTIYNINQDDRGYDGIASASGHESSGVFIESQCSGWTVSENLIYNVGNEGIIFSFHTLEAGQSPNYALNNTIYNVQNGFFLKEGVLTIKNNIVKNAVDVAMCLGCGSGSYTTVTLTADYNLYDDGATQTKIGFKDGTTYNLADWRTQCSCDANSITGDPLFVSNGTDFHLQAKSPARGAGESGVDQGAFPYSAADCTQRVRIGRTWLITKVPCP